MSEIELRSISKAFTSKSVLSQVSLRVPKRAFSVLLGPSGCGKTTLLRIIAGLEQADAGQVLLDGHDISSTPVQERGVGLVFQNYALWPHMSVAENIAFGLRVQKVPRAQLLQRVSQALEAVQLAEFAEARPQQLSGGQQQRVALARVLALKPRVILLDEPLSNLDTRLREEVRQQLLRLHRETEVTMVMVTHDREEALSIATHVALLMQGRLAQEGPPRELYQRPVSSEVARFLGEVNVWTARVLQSGGVDRRLELAEGVQLALAHDSRALQEQPAGALVQVLVRPERLRLTKPQGTAPEQCAPEQCFPEQCSPEKCSPEKCLREQCLREHCLEARIEELRFQGAFVSARCRLYRQAGASLEPCALEALVLSTSGEAAFFGVGDHVQLRYAADDIQIVEQANQHA
jgi:spermidine/putrescine transport system ATP-binding protein